jgi:hypothetical protein
MNGVVHNSLFAKPVTIGFVEKKAMADVPNFFPYFKEP